MFTKLKIPHIVGILLSLSLAFTFVYVQLLSKDDLVWFVMLSGALLGAFSLELWKTINGRRISWDFYSAKDKLLFFYSLVTVLVFTFLPVRLQVPVWMFICSMLAGYLLSWVPIYLFGSKSLKKNWLWQRSDLET